MPNKQFRDVKLMMGAAPSHAEILMGAQSQNRHQDLLMSIRKVMQKPDVSSIQIMSWLRGQRKEKAQATKKQGREWSRFMSAYLGSNANANGE